jgi:hypothetical protein
MRIRLFPCDPTLENRDCASEQEIRDYFYDADLNYFFTNTYYDPSSYPESHEISSYIES